METMASPYPTIGSEQEANTRFQAGLRYYDAREFEQARLAFTQAYSVLPKPGILINRQT